MKALFGICKRNTDKNKNRMGEEHSHQETLHKIGSNRTGRTPSSVPDPEHKNGSNRTGRTPSPDLESEQRIEALVAAGMKEHK